VLKRSGIEVPELDDRPPFPEAISYVWAWYIELVNTTSLGYSEIKAWSDLMGASIKGWEVSAIMRLEKMRLKHG